MAAHDVITLADLKAYGPMVGTGRDAALARYISAASRMIEDDLGRRLRFRAPAEAVADIVATVTLADGSLTIANQPNAAGRTIFAEVTDVDSSITAGLLTLTGTVEGVSGVTEMIDLTVPGKQHGMKFFTALSAATVSGMAGHTAADKIRVGTTVGYVEYHTPRYPCYSEILPLEWPVQQILELNEDAGRAYGTSTKLVNGTDYLLTRPNQGDKLVRLSSQQARPWLTSWRAEKLVHSAGYNIATMPDPIKDVSRRLVKLMYDEVEKNRLGLSGSSDAQGNWTRFAPVSLTREMRQQISAFRRFRCGADTGERDFDLEAA